MCIEKLNKLTKANEIDLISTEIFSNDDHKNIVIRGNVEQFPYYLEARTNHEGEHVYPKLNGIFYSDHPCCKSKFTLSIDYSIEY